MKLITDQPGLMLINIIIIKSFYLIFRCLRWMVMKLPDGYADTKKRIA